MLKNKKILVTGADGFIGSHLTEMLVSMGLNVRALVQYNSLNEWGWLESCNERSKLEVLSGDIRDPHYCINATKDVDVIFHLAALIAIPFSYVAPDSYIDTNVKGTLNICQAALENNVQRVIHTSTSEVYGSAKYVPINEDHPLQPQSPYSASKIAADAIAMSFYNSFDLPLTTVRPFNTYGPRQSARAVIPTVITQILSGKTKIKLGSTKPTRDFNFVNDTCKGFIQLSETTSSIGDTINIGSNQEISIGDLVILIAEIMETDITIETEEQRKRPEKSEVDRLLCDNTKIFELTGFNPTFSLRQGLEQTIEWFRNPDNLRRYKTEIYNV